MNKARQKLIDEIFTAALDRPAPEREIFVRTQCGDDDLFGEVLELLRVSEIDNDVENRLSNARNEVLRSVFDDSKDSGEDLSGQRVDIWIIDKPIARGGLSTVYLAHRDDGTFDQVAVLKVLRRGLDTDDLIARFRTERQILSALEHPAIAQILDGGALPDGRPFLVLEYIDGVPITDYCIDNRLSVRDRVILMIESLRALHHAHQHLVVHRDVKPSNILVTSTGDVSLLDFGIAKLLDAAKIPGERMHTRTGISLLTPGYGSPEQHAGAAVTTASDIYQTGLVLFEMLTGERPVEGLTENRQTSPLIASHKLRDQPEFKEVRGDLDAIIRMATRGDPNQRYASADEMVKDLQRYLDGLPVLAQQDSIVYRASKFSRRYRWLLPALVIGALGFAAYVGALRAHNDQLETEKNRATEAQDFLVNLLKSADPFAPAAPDRGSTITVVEALDIGVERLRAQHYSDESLNESLLTSIASVYTSLDRHQQGIDLREESLELQKSLYGVSSEPVLNSLRILANEYKTIGNYTYAEELIDEQLSLAKTQYRNTDPLLGVAEAAAGAFYLRLGKSTDGERLLVDGAIKMRRESNHYARLIVNAEVKIASARLGSMQTETLALLNRTHELAISTFGPRSLSVALVNAQTGVSLSSYGNFSEAEVRLRTALELYEAQLGRRHGSTLAALYQVGLLYDRTARHQMAEAIHRELLETYLQKYGPKHRGVADAYQAIATAVGHQGLLIESVEIHKKANEAYRLVLNPDNPRIAAPLLSIAVAELEMGNTGNALSASRSALQFLDESSIASELHDVASCLVDLSLQGGAQDGKSCVGNHIL